MYVYSLLSISVLFDFISQRFQDPATLFSFYLSIAHPVYSISFCPLPFPIFPVSVQPKWSTRPPAWFPTGSTLYRCVQIFFWRVHLSVACLSLFVAYGARMLCVAKCVYDVRGRKKNVDQVRGNGQRRGTFRKVSRADRRKFVASRRGQSNLERSLGVGDNVNRATL